MLAFGQQAASVLKVIPLENPSFEEIAGHSKTPWGWNDCGFAGESPPDIHPDFKSPFKVSTKAYDGRTYLGLVVRDNDTYESVSQKLPEALKADSCYTFSFFVARSDSYVSVSRITGQEANYNKTATFRIFGGFDNCEKWDLLATSEPINKMIWNEIELSFVAKGNYTHLIVEAYYKMPKSFAYNGNVLLDNVTLYKGCKAEEVKK